MGDLVAKVPAIEYCLKLCFIDRSSLVKTLATGSEL